MDHRTQEKVDKNVKILSTIGSYFYGRELMLSTSGNLSSVLNEKPFELMISASGVEKGDLNGKTFIIVNSSGERIQGEMKPSAETLLHIAVVKTTGAKFVFHTHSVYSTLVSCKYKNLGEIILEGYEMLKALNGVNSHLHKEVIPILENRQDMLSLSKVVEEMLSKKENLHCFLLSGHGLYTWGNSSEEAKRHLDALEFLLEVFWLSNNS